MRSTFVVMTIFPVHATTDVPAREISNSGTPYAAIPTLKLRVRQLADLSEARQRLDDARSMRALLT